MPPRKSTASVASAAPPVSPGAAGDVSVLSTTTLATIEPKSPTAHKNSRHSTGGGGGGDADGEKSEKKKHKNDDLGIDDLLLPRTLTSRLSRGTLPPNTSIQRDALLALTKSATVFISYLAHNANSLTARKTIQSQDILDALRETELWNVTVPGLSGGDHGSVTLGERVRAEVEKWEGEVRGKRKGYRDRVKARESGVSEVDGVGGEEDEEEQGRGPVAKKVRRADGEMDVDGDGDAAAAAAQLLGDDSVANGDATDTDPEAGEDEDEGEGDDVEDDEEQDEDEVDAEEAEDEDESRRDRLDVDDDDGRRRTALAPNGRVEVGSDEESD